jgi:RNA polymerase sigma-70 factor (ECF subfamily)
MSEELGFRDLILRVRAGDEEAAAQLVRRYEPAIRRAVQLRLHDSDLRRHLDSMDVCQSVLASFFVRAALGQYRLDEPEQLLRLLSAMARNKVAHQARRERAGRRDYRRRTADEDGAYSVPDPSPSPSAQVAAADLVEQARQRLTPQELHLLELRRQGRTWPEIASELGDNPDALRIRLDRAVQRVTRDLGLDEMPDE